MPSHASLQLYCFLNIYLEGMPEHHHAGPVHIIDKSRQTWTLQFSDTGRLQALWPRQRIVQRIVFCAVFHFCAVPITRRSCRKELAGGKGGEEG